MHRAELALPDKRKSRVGWTGLAVVPLVVVLSIPPLFWFAHHWTVTVDAGRYLLGSRHLISGQGYTLIAGNPEIKRGPIFDGLIGLFMVFFGRNTESLAWAIRLVALINPVLAYFLVKRFSRPIAGLVAAGMVTLLSYTAINPDALNIDAPLLTVYLLMLLALISAIRKDTAFLALLSGLLLGVSILTKETAFVNLPLGLIAVLLFGWSLRSAMWHYLALALVCLPWWIRVWHVSGEIYLAGRLPAKLQVLAVAAAVVFVCFVAVGYLSGLFARFLAHEHLRRWTGGVLVLAWTVALAGFLLSTGSDKLSSLSPGTLRVYIFERLPTSLAAWPLLLVAVVYVIWKVVRGGWMWRLFGVILLFQAPILLLVTVEGWDRRQFLIPQTLLLCAFAVLIVNVCATALQRSEQSILPRVAAVLLTSALLAFALFEVGVLFLDNPSEVSRGSTQALEDLRMARWMSQNVPKEKTLTTAAQANYLAFLSNDRHNWALLKLDQSSCVQNPTSTKQCNGSNNDIYRTPPDAVWLNIDSNCRATSLSMSHLLNQARRKNAGYVMLTSYNRFPGILALGSNLEASGAFEVAHEELSYNSVSGEQGLVLLSRTGRQPRTVPTQISAQSVLHLRECKRAEGANFFQKTRFEFPNGFELIEPSSLPANNAENLTKLNARARQIVDGIYPNGVAGKSAGSGESPGNNS